MNEQLKNLYELSQITTTRNVINGGQDNDRPPYKYTPVSETHFDPKLFAQLIINECVSRMGNQLRQQGFTPEAWREAVLDAKHFLVSDK